MGRWVDVCMLNDEFRILVKIRRTLKENFFNVVKFNII